MDKYIIYTMGVPEINEAVQKVLFDKGYTWNNGSTQIYDGPIPHGLTINYGNKVGVFVSLDRGDMAKGYKEITFRELMELPPVHDEEEELAEKIVASLYEISKEYRESQEYIGFDKWVKQQNWCKVQEKVKKKLGL